MLSLITEHGRATPLIWLTVDKKTLKDQRNLYEDRLLVRLPRSCRRRSRCASSPTAASAIISCIGC